MKESYKGLKVGQKVLLTKSVKKRYNQGFLERGTECTIKGFPEKVYKVPCPNCNTGKCKSNDYFVLLSYGTIQDTSDLVGVDLCCIVKQ